MPRRLRNYAISLSALAAAVLLRWLLDPWLGDHVAVVLTLGAVAVAVWLQGYVAALIIATLGFIAADYLFIPPRYALSVSNAAAATTALAYAFTCGVLIWIGEALRRARRDAAQHGEMLRVTLASIGDAVATTDTEGRVTYLNGVAEGLTGWTTAQAQGMPLDGIFRIVNESTREVVESPVSRALREGTVVGLANHTVLIAKDGAERPIDDSAAPIRDDAGRIVGAVLVFRDVSQRRQAERDRADRLGAARLLAAIVESSDDAIISKTLDGVIRTWNAGAERLFGHRAGEAIGRHISLVIPPDRLDEETQIIARLTAGERIDHFETERIRKDGTRVLLSLTISPIRDDTGKVVGASKIARDITERRRMEGDLRKLADDLSRADRRKDEFMATLAHELRNPLAPLRNMLEFLKRADADPDGRRRALGTMERQLTQLVRLVDDLLDINRITHDRLELRKRRLDVRRVVEQVIEACRPLAQAADHVVSKRLPAEALYVEGDEARIAQVLSNLVNNSCKYTDPGGRIEVAVTRAADDVVITVSDDGIGIPPARLDDIFEMFAQIDQTSERTQGGLGIGLTLVKRLVQMHGGTVQARSAGPGQGSTFEVRLPAVAAPAAETAPPPAEDRIEVVPLRILVVDDNRDAAASLAMLLEMTGHQTHTAHDGPGALDAVNTHRPEVVLLDIGLPTLNGYEVCRRVRQQPWGKDIFLVALTGWGQEKDRRESREAGFDGHLVKPVEYVSLVDLLSTRPRDRSAAR